VDKLHLVMLVKGRFIIWKIFQNIRRFLM